MALSPGSRSERALAALALVILTACPEREPSPRPTATTTSTTAARAGGTVTVAYPAEPTTLDPFTLAGDSPATRDITRLLMPAFFLLGANGERRLWLLAEEPVVSAGAGRFSVTFSIRDDARWSDGSPITVSDVRATARRALRGPPSVRDGYDRIRRIVPISSKRARIDFAKPFRRWQDLFAAGLGVVPAKAGSLASGWKLSGGPFRLRSWVRGREIVLQRNPRAFPTETQLDRLRIAFIPDTTGAVELMERGKVDVLGPYRSPDWTRRAAVVGDVTSDIGATWAGLLLNTQAGPLRERAVRRALSIAFERDRIAEGLVGTEGEPLDSPEPQLVEDDRPGVSVTTARARLNDAGWRGAETRRKGGRRLAFTLAVPTSDHIAQIVTRALTYQAAAVGFAVEAVPLDHAEFWDGWMRSELFEAALIVWRDPPGGGARGRFGTGAGTTNRARLRDATLDRAVEAADALQPDGDFRPLVAALRAAAPVVPLYRVRVSLAASGVCGVVASAAADGPFWNAGEWRAEPC